MPEIGQLPGQQFYTTLKIKDVFYNPSNIVYLIIREWVFNVVPTVEIQFFDDGYLVEAFPLEDQEDIEITLAKSEDSEELMEMVFSMDDYSYDVLADNRRTVVTITGHLKVDDMFTRKNRRFTTQNSSLVCQQIANESDLKFSNPRNVTPSDNMVWYQCGLSNYDFIKHVLRRSYIPNDATFFYANTDNEFVFTSLLSEIDKKESIDARFNIEKAGRNILENKNEIWYATYNTVNYSGYYNKLFGYGSSYSYYDLNNQVGDTITNVPKLSSLTFRNKDMIGSSLNCYCGGDYISRNLYGDKYFESRVRNDMLIYNFFGLSIVLDINSLTKVKLFDKVDLEIPSLLVENELNEAFSGEYLVGGVQHEVSKGGIYRKKISIHRNGMDESVEINEKVVEK